MTSNMGSQLIQQRFEELAGQSEAQREKDPRNDQDGGAGYAETHHTARILEPY